MTLKLSQWYRQLQVRSKILLGVGSLVIMCMLLILTFYSALSVSGKALQKVANEEEPTSASTYEMELNVVKTDLDVMNFMRSGDSAFRKDALEDKINFEQHLVRYQNMANNDQEIGFAKQVEKLHQDYWVLAEQLMDERASLELSVAISQEQINLTDSTLDESLSGISSRRSQAAARRQLLQQMKTSLAKMGKDLGAYLRLGEVASSQDISNEAEQFLVQLNYYRGFTQTRVEKVRTQQISESFDATYEAITRAMSLHDQTEKKLSDFFTIRTTLDELLSERMLPTARLDLETAKVTAERTARRAKMWAALFAPIILLIAFAAVYILTRSVTRPATQLVTGAAAIGSGQLQYRIPDLGEDELGELGRQFNEMAKRLETTTVSRDSLEESEAALRVSEERYARAVSGTNDGLFDWDMIENTVYFSPRFRAMMGYSEELITDDPESYFRYVHPDDIDLLRQNISLYFDRPGEYLVNEHRVLNSDGTYRWVLFRALASDETGSNRTTRLSGSQTDINTQKLAEQQLVHDAMHDRLTGLPNRHLLLDRLQHFLDSEKRRQSELCGLLFMDLDGFKMINDSMGHPAGDGLLVTLASRLRNYLSANDTLARFGGDEFVILAEDLSSEEEIETMAVDIQEALEKPVETGHGESFVSASIGIALSSHNYTRAEDMLRDADIAMYRAKAMGKKRHVFFDNSMHGHVVARAQLENDLRVALEREQFEIYYQPIIDLQDSRKLVGFEALLRWNHPTRGLIRPDEFIPLLEESGLIVPVGEWLLQTACTTAKSWHRANYKPWVSVNVSAVQLQEAGLVAAVFNALEESKLKPEFLTLEITETNVMQNENLARNLLSKVKQLGVKLSIDDFGVGYSSLSYLTRFPWDYVKIDRSFVRDIANNKQDAAIIEAIITMVHSLEFDVVAEGIEDVEQLAALRDFGIDCVQGYLLARPAAKSEWDGLNSLSSKRFLKQAFEHKSAKIA
ncbi:MAG: EAL domain-containing protein [Gammaproteobacteria bacterium]|nr:EAL domain-containing protein [Gammaproteobacteria bacterium]NNC97021.1 EAL domain-containing protein [Gammaproteobacteria bacterium]NNM13873.1 EAL domain-containing protein [Gammaproteobacteria bacterium]